MRYPWQSSVTYGSGILCIRAAGPVRKVISVMQPNNTCTGGVYTSDFAGICRIVGYKEGYRGAIIRVPHDAAVTDKRGCNLVAFYYGCRCSCAALAKFVPSCKVGMNFL